MIYTILNVISSAPFRDSAINSAASQVELVQVSAPPIESDGFQLSTVTLNHELLHQIRRQRKASLKQTHAYTDDFDDHFEEAPDIQLPASRTTFECGMAGCGRSFRLDKLKEHLGELSDF